MRERSEGSSMERVESIRWWFWEWRQWWWWEGMAKNVKVE